MVRGEIKNCTLLWRKAHFEVKLLKKTEGPGTLFEVLMSENCTLLRRKAHSEVEMLKKKLRVREHFLKF